MTNKLVGSYINGSYFVKMYEDGTKIRLAPKDTFHPAFAENMDITITERCSNACKFCYQGCTPEGKHADFSKYEYLIDSLHPYTEVALNGNNLDIDGLEEFLQKLKDKKVFANITVHQSDFEKHTGYLKKLVNNKLIWGIGVSLVNPTKEFITRIKLFKNIVIHVINGIFTEEQYNALKDQDLKILILGYKDIGRGVDYLSNTYEQVSKNQQWLNENLPTVIENFEVVSFDNNALEQLEVGRIMSDEEWDEFYLGDEGAYSFFINLVQGYFAMNSMSPNHYPITEGMTIDDMFNVIRGKIC